MSSFTNRLTISPFNKKTWEVIDEFEFYRGDTLEDSTGLVRVQAGFVTDGASVPRGFWWICPRWDAQYGKAAVLHDKLYASHEKSRKESDEIFMEAMEVLGVSKWKRKMMYRAVRMFGRRSYNSAPARQGKHRAAASST